MIKEIWKPIPCVKGFYEVSNLGRIKRAKISNVSKWRTKVGQIIKPQKRTAGYLFSRLSVDGVNIVRNIHALVLESFVGPCPKGSCINHKNGIKPDNRLENLEYVTFCENNLHASRFLKKGIGESHGMAKLTEEKVKYIRSTPKFKRNSGQLLALAKKMGVSRDTIINIRKRKVWTHI